MATIGAFYKQEDGGFVGAIKTLTLHFESVIVRPAAKSGHRAPDYRIYTADIEVGAAWRKTGQDHRDYLAVQLDDLSFEAPIYATLLEVDDGYSLVWSRRRTDP